MPRLDLIRANTKKLVLSELLHKRRMPAFVQKVQTVFFADFSKRFGYAAYRIRIVGASYLTGPALSVRESDRYAYKIQLS